MNGLGKELLAAAGGAFEQHGGLGGGHALGQGLGLGQGGGGANHGGKAVLGTHLLFEVGHSALQAGFLDGALHDDQQLVVGVAFNEVVESAAFHGLHAVGDVAVGGEQDDFGGGGLGFEAGQKRHAVGVGQLHVAENNEDFGGVLLQSFEAAAGVGGLQHGVAFEAEHPGEDLPQVGFVVDEQDGAVGHG